MTSSSFALTRYAYDTVNHLRLLTKILQMTKKPLLICFFGVTLKNQRFFVEFNVGKSRV